MAMRRAIFIDKDGTLIPDIPFNTDPARISYTPGAGQALRNLHNHGFAIILISNQPGVARGLFNATALDEVSARINDIALSFGFQFTAFYYCIHDARDNCSCRKPKPGLLQNAATEHGIDPSASWMVGDILNDVEAGHEAGCRSILVDNGGETEWQIKRSRIPEYICSTMEDIPRLILSASG
jgi:histidinol-phosphate phosphatase family protein